MLKNSYPKYPRAKRIPPIVLIVLAAIANIIIFLALAGALFYLLWNVVFEPYLLLKLSYKQSVAAVALVYFIRFLVTVGHGSNYGHGQKIFMVGKKY